MWKEAGESGRKASVDPLWLLLLFVEFKTARWFNAAVAEHCMAGVTATSKRMGPAVQMTGCHVTAKQAAVS